MSIRDRISKFWGNTQLQLFPFLEKDLGPLSEEHKKVAAICELVRIEEFIACTKFNLGRPVKSRCQVARAFIAKAILNISYTKDLVERLRVDTQLRVICGWEIFSRIPSESLFCRAFKEFSQTNLPEKVHQALVSQIYEGQIVGQITKDSTPLIAMESVPKMPKWSRKERKKLKNKELAKEKRQGTSRKQRQLGQSLEEMVKDLPKGCDIGVKQNSQGYKTFWKGYKFHAAVDDHCIPLACILTSASLNDSEVAIPLAAKTDRLVKNFYDLMDAAYDEVEIRQHSLSLGHVPIIDKHSRSKRQKEEKNQEKRRKKLLKFYTAEDKRYRERFSKERFNALLKNFYGGRNIIYKGAEKIFCHLMFGVLGLTGTMIMKLLE